MEWPSLRRPIQAKKQLLVEGRTPEIFFREWVEAIGLKGQVEVRDYQSLSQLTDYLKVFTGYKEFRELPVDSLGIIRDAEDQPAASAFNSVCSSLRAVGLNRPEKPCVFSDGMPKTGIFVLPDCERAGMLETLCWSVLQADAKYAGQLTCATAYLDCLRAAKVEVHNETKAKVWAYLAGTGRFDPMVGRAAQAKLWDWTSPVLRPLSEFLKSL